MDDAIGRRLRKLRSRAQCSQRQLARAAGVSNAMISLIETGRSNPSLGLLKRILDAIPISMAEFFAIDVEQRRQWHFRRDELTEIGGGNISFLQVGAHLRPDGLQVLQERYGPGADTGSAMLSHEGEEGGIVVSGKLEVTVGDETRVLGPGDAYRFDSRIPHRFRNIGKSDCVLVSACTPPSF